MNTEPVLVSNTHNLHTRDKMNNKQEEEHSQIG